MQQSFSSRSVTEKGLRICSKPVRVCRPAQAPSLARLPGQCSGVQALATVKHPHFQTVREVTGGHGRSLWREPREGEGRTFLGNGSGLGFGEADSTFPVPVLRVGRTGPGETNTKPNTCQYFTDEVLRVGRTGPGEEALGPSRSTPGLACAGGACEAPMP